MDDDDKLNFHGFIEKLFEDTRFGWYAILCFDSRRMRASSAAYIEVETAMDAFDPKRRIWDRLPKTASDCFKQWVRRSGIEAHDYVCVREDRKDGTVRFFVFVCQWWRYDDSVLSLWRSFSGGWAMKKPLPENPKGMVGNKVMREGCTLIVHLGWKTQEYTSDDFVPWKPKDEDRF